MFGTLKNTKVHILFYKIRVLIYNFYFSENITTFVKYGISMNKIINTFLHYSH